MTVASNDDGPASAAPGPAVEAAPVPAVEGGAAAPSDRVAVAPAPARIEVSAAPAPASSPVAWLGRRLGGRVGPPFTPAEETLPARPLATRSAGEPLDFVPLPAARRTRWLGPTASFVAMVLVPLTALAAYFSEFASPQYMAEFRFSVTEVQPTSGSLPSVSSGGAAMASVASSLAGGGGINGGSAQNYVVVDYLKSRQAVDELSAKVDIRALYSRPEIDWWSRFDATRSPEKLVDYWNRMVTANYDSVTGLATAQVTAFRPEDALLIARTLVVQSEGLVNEIAKRAQEDAVRFAEDEVARAQEHLKKVRVEVAEFRAREGVIEPNASIVSSNVQLAAGLRAALSQLQTEYASMLSQKVDPKAPSMSVLTSRMNATRAELDRVEREVAGERGGRAALARVVARFEALELDRQHAQTLLLSALQSLERARASAAAKHLYLTPYVRPALPGSPKGPAVARSLAVAAFALLGIWLATLLAWRSVRGALA